MRASTYEKRAGVRTSRRRSAAPPLERRRRRSALDFQLGFNRDTDDSEGFSAFLQKRKILKKGASV